MKLNEVNKWCVRIAAAVCMLVAAARCHRHAGDEQDDAYEALLESERMMRSSLHREHAESPENQIAIRLVQTSAAPDGQGAVTQWVERVLTEYATTLFPRWAARKTAVGRYDVRFTCLVTDAMGAAHPIGYTWSADLALSLVYGPRAMTEEELRAEWKGRFRYPGPSTRLPEERAP